MKVMPVKKFRLVFVLFILTLFGGLAFLIVYGDAALLIPMPVLTVWVGAWVPAEYQNFRDKLYNLKRAAPLFVIGLSALAGFFFLTRADHFILAAISYLIVITSFFFLAVRSNEQRGRRGF